MRWEQISLPCEEGGGATTAYRLSPAGEAKRVVLTLHGAGNDAFFAWIGLYKRLLTAGGQVFTFDLPGHGRFNQTAFTPAAASASLRTALDECGTASPELPLHAIGVSLGGSLLLASLADLQHRFASAALVVAPVRIESSVPALAREVSLRTLSLLWREREHYGLTGLIPSFGSFKRDVYPLRLAVDPPAGTFGYVAALNEALASLDLEGAARNVDLPVLLAYGDRDRIVPPRQGARLAGLLRHGELLTVPGGTHLSTPLEEQTLERLTRWVEEWP